MQAFARDLPDRVTALSGAARDLTATTARRARRELDRARDLGGALQRRVGGFVDRDARPAVTRLTRRELDRARDMSSLVQSRLEGALRRDRRSSRLPVAISVVVVGAAIGGALLASPRVRASLRQGWDYLRGRRPDAAIRAPDGAAWRVREGLDGAAWKPAEERQEDLLDEAIEESFPASDPVSVKRIT